MNFHFVCHPARSEGSRFARVYFVLLEILRFAQDDKWGFVFLTVGAIHESPAVSAPDGQQM